MPPRPCGAAGRASRRCSSTSACPLDGLELAARVLSRFAHPPEIIFVTAFEQHAVEAFELQAVDYLLKPVRPERLSDAIRRLGAPPRRADDDGTPATGRARTSWTASPSRPAAAPGWSSGTRSASWRPAGLRAPAQRRRRLPRPHADPRYEDAWRDAGFVRVHRRYLIALRHVTELRPAPGGGYDLVVAGQELPVSRRMPGSSATGCPAAPTGPGGQVCERVRSGRPARRRPQPAGPCHPVDDARRTGAGRTQGTDRGRRRVLLRSLTRAQLMLAVRIFAVFGSSSSACPPSSPPTPTWSTSASSDCRCRGSSSAGRSTRCWSSSLSSTCARPAQRAATSSSSIERS